MYRTSFVRAGAIARTARPFSTTMRARVDAADAVKDTAKKVDRTVSDQLVTGIDKSSELANSLMKALGMNAEEAKSKARELSGEAQKKAGEVTGQAKGAAAEAEGKAKGAAAEAKSKLS